MAIGSGAKGEEPITAINITPLVDVCLVLVIIFMAVAPMAVTLGIKVLESKAGAAQGKATADENVTVKLSLDGKITVNGKEVPRGQHLLQPTITDALLKSKDRMVIVSADDGNKVGEVVAILDIAKQAGALKVAILKEEAAPAGKKG
jgi:biopolymer transport protein ExbD